MKPELQSALRSIERIYGKGALNETEQDRAIAAIRMHVASVVRFNHRVIAPAPVSIAGSWDNYGDYIQSVNKKRAAAGLRPWSY